MPRAALEKMMMMMMMLVMMTKPTQGGHSYSGDIKQDLCDYTEAICKKIVGIYLYDVTNLQNRDEIDKCFMYICIFFFSLSSAK